MQMRLWFCLLVVPYSDVSRLKCSYSIESDEGTIQLLYSLSKISFNPDPFVPKKELLDKLHPMEAKRRCDELEGSLKIVETTVNAILQDVHTLREGNYVKGESLHKRSLTLYQRWVTLRKRMQVNGMVNW